MVNLSDWVNELGGMAQKRQLARRGAGDRDLTFAVRTLDVVRVRNGWYSTLSEDDPRLRAVRVGGRLTGLSALAQRGAWMLEAPPLHVSVHENAARLRSQWNRRARLDPGDTRGVILHWDPPTVRRFGDATTVGLIDALERVVLDETFETAVAVLDWALHTAALDPFDFDELVRRLPAERRGIADWVDADCDSLPESLARTRLRQRNWTVESQVVMTDGRPIDLVVEGQVAIEVDGEKYHLNRFEYDRDKDLEIAIDHWQPLRPSARAVFHNWSRLQLAIETALADRGVTVENSGHAHRPRRLNRGISGWTRRRARRLPEFATGNGSGRREYPRVRLRFTPS